MDVEAAGAVVVLFGSAEAGSIVKGTKLSNFLRGLTRYRLCRWKGGRSSPDSKEEAHVEHGGAEGMRNSGKGYLLESIHALGTSVAIFCFEVLEKRSARRGGIGRRRARGGPS